MKKTRRQALKSFFGLGFVSFIPIRIIADNECNPTTSDILGPYFIEGVPNLQVIAPNDGNTNRLFITGTVYANDCITPIPNVLIDVWQANKEGAYEDIDFRGKIYSDEGGNYAFESIQPGKYLNGSYYRPSHIHYKLVYLNNPEFITQLYFEGDTSIPLDPWASDPSAEERIIPLSTDDNNDAHGVFDIILNINPETLSTDYWNRSDSASKIKSIHPNPVKGEFNLKIHLPKTSDIILEICDVNGRAIQIIYSNTINSNTEINIQRPNISNGVYILRMKVNGVYVDAKRILFV